MEESFSRYSALIGQDKIDYLATKKVAIFGVGGVGGICAIALARAGIKHFLIVDNDKVNISNINRQIVANYQTIGQYKVDVIKDMIMSISPDATVEIYKTFYLPGNNDIPFLEADYIIDAIDTITAKIDIIIRAKTKRVAIISAMGCGNRLDPSKVMVSDIYKTNNDPLAKIMRKQLRMRGIDKLKVVYSNELPTKPFGLEDNNGRHTPGSSVFVTNVSGLFLASEVINDLLKAQ